MSASIFELWLKGREINNTKVWKLEGDGDTGLYKLQSWRECNHNFYGDTPTYHVWVNGKRIAVTTNYHSAYAAWINNRP